ncbi:EF hand [Teladorsagia circumcincta]|uniref:EF hand n=1 Tax=Teladorsagia circumcincta TaxID=45464 RepID=A0A2G9V5T5_TELCI|nr:EF hand [Teladorsagia circumcincta]
MYEFAYSKYLEEVVKILESEPKFSEKLRGMPEADIKAGKIADHIDDLDGHVFDKLTKAKLDELERLREQIQKQIEAEGGAHNVKIPDHLDATNWERFGKEDLRKLIRRTVEDMETIDRERQKKFKEYEMRKKAEEDHKLAQMNEEERLRALHEAEEAKKRHNEHEKLKHPGSRDQLEEVWEDTDHMDKDNFDPRTFFALHDLNGDGYWNADELEALFQKELEKVYNETDPDDDPRERMEEMYRMREHVTKQMDKNGDRLISLDEFLQDTEAQTPNKDPGWKDLGDQQVYTDEELKEFEREYAKNQGWGEHAYDITTPAPSTTVPQAQPIHQQPQQNAQQPAQPVYQQQAQPVPQQQQV